MSGCSAFASALNLFLISRSVAPAVDAEDGVGRPLRCVGADDASYVRGRAAHWRLASTDDGTV